MSLKKKLFAALMFSGAVLTGGAASAETLMEALAKAYQYNATLNSERAGVRIYDEDIAIAKSGYRPQINGIGSYSRGRSAATGYYTNVGSIGIELSQTLFDGFQTYNNVQAAEAQAAAQREALRNTEQNQLSAAIAAYADVYMTRQILTLRRQNLDAMNEQVRSDQARLDVGEGTRTDLAQSQAQRASAISALELARADVKSAEAVYRQVIGVEPESLERPTFNTPLPKSIEEGLVLAAVQHPAIQATKLAVEAAGFNVKAYEGALLPQVGVSASTSYNRIYHGPDNGQGRSNSIGLNLTVPIYSGGRTSAQVRQSKEQLGQARIQVDLQENTVRQALVSAWAQLEGARASVSANRESVRAYRIALDGMIEENRVGQRTTLDVLLQRNFLVDAQIALVQAERDVVVSSYNVQSALGLLSAQQLALDVTPYDPEVHYRAVKDKWIGLRTPSGE